MGGSLENERECRRRRRADDVCVLERRKRRGFLLKQTSRLDDDDDDDDGREKGEHARKITIGDISSCGRVILRGNGEERARPESGGE